MWHKFSQARCPTCHPTNSAKALTKESNKKKIYVFTLIIESIDTVDAGTLMVATKQKEVLGIFDLVCK